MKFVLLLPLLPVAIFSNNSMSATPIELSNDDGNVTVVRPQLNKSDGTSLPIGSDSDIDGVCKLYRHDNGAVRTAVQFATEEKQMARVDSEGTFAGYSQSKTSISSIICVVPSSLTKGAGICDDGHRCRITRNGDLRTSVIKSPTYYGADNWSSYLSHTPGPYPSWDSIPTVRFISSHSDLDGVCMHFGFTKFVTGSLIVQGQAKNFGYMDFPRITYSEFAMDPTALIGADGRLVGLAQVSSKEARDETATISSVTCE